MPPNANGARDRFAVDAVEGPRGRDTFDGNHTSDVVSWLIPFPGQQWMPLSAGQMEQLMDWTEAGHLAWVVFPIDNTL